MGFDKDVPEQGVHTDGGIRVPDEDKSVPLDNANKNDSTGGEHKTPSDIWGIGTAAPVKVKKKRFVLPEWLKRFKPMKQSDSKSPKAVRLLRKYWYIVLLILAVIAGLTGWRMHQMQIDAKWSKASDYFGRADYKAAAEEIEGLSLPDDEKRLSVYSQTMLATRQLDKALPGYQKLYGVKKDPSVKLVIGNIYNEQKKYDEAAKTYRELIDANASFVQAYVNLSTLYKMQGKNTEAIEIAKKGVAANPNNVTVHELLISMLLEQKDSADYKNAVATLKKINPNDPIFESIKE